ARFALGLLVRAAPGAGAAIGRTLEERGLRHVPLFLRCPRGIPLNRRRLALLLDVGGGRLRVVAHLGLRRPVPVTAVAALIVLVGAVTVVVTVVIAVVVAIIVARARLVGLVVAALALARGLIL